MTWWQALALLFAVILAAIPLAFAIHCADRWCGKNLREIERPTECDSSLAGRLILPPHKSAAK